LFGIQPGSDWTRMIVIVLLLSVVLGSFVVVCVVR
jgi:hypothetical protein